MEHSFEFSHDELYEFMKDTNIYNIEKCIDELVAFCRFKQREYVYGDETVSGHEVLNRFHQDGLIKTSAYLKIRQLIDNPNADYTIKITDV